MLLHYLKIAIRNLWKHKVQSIINILGLSIGITAFSLSVYWYQWEHSFDTFHPNWQNIYAITTTGIFKTNTGEEGELNQLHRNDRDIFATYPQIKEMSNIKKTWGYIDNEQKNDARFVGYDVDSAFFSLFYMKFLLGGIHGIPFNCENIVLTRSAAMRQFGTIECVGEFVSIDKGRSLLKVVGIVEDYPENTELIFDVLMLSSDDKLANNQDRTTCYVSFHNKKEADHFRTLIETHKSVADDPYGINQPHRWNFNLRALPDVHFTCNPTLKERFRNINILFWTGLLLLVCALMNNLVLFIGQQQYKLRGNITYVSFGASGFSLVCGYLIILFIPVLFASTLALGVIELLFPFFENFSTIKGVGVNSDHINSMSIENLIQGSIFNLSIALLVYFLLAMIPILRFVRFSKNKSTHSSSLFFRRILVTGQIFIGSLFFITSLFLFKQLYFIKNQPKGIEVENVLQVYLGYDTAFKHNFSLIKANLLEIPNIKDVTLTVDPILLSDGLFNNIGILRVDGRDIEPLKADKIYDNFFYVENNFFSFFNIPFKEGHSFGKNEEMAYVLNETGAKSMAVDNYLQTTTHNGRGRIVGIAQDYHYSPMRYTIQPVVFTIRPETLKQSEAYKYIYIKTSDNDLSRIKNVIAEFDHGEVSDKEKFVWLSEIEDEFNRPEETIFSIFSVFSFLCILISSFGIYSLVALTAEQRMKEIAIRKINGAAFKDILSLFLKEYLILVILGNMFALSLGYFFVKSWLETYAYHTGINTSLFFFVFFTTCGIVIFSVAKQVMLASKQSPIKMLKK
ncbi:ABC transporter permease [Bacteroidales bacterium OttesenSCG-928-M11]|nr:ABC transporter permease [Bacteroidales bacterium OttesenSCG-928-M11]